MTKCLTCGMDGRECFCGSSPMTADTPAASKDAPTDEAVMVNIAGNVQDLERAKEHARLLLKRVAAGPVGDGLSHAEYALLCLYAHVATLTEKLEAERAEAEALREAVENITSKSPLREPSPSRTTNDPDDAFDQGYDRAMWDADAIARATLAQPADGGK